MSRAMRPPVRTHLESDDQERLDREAAARGVSVSQCIRDCLREYFALRAEVATALDGPGPTPGGDAAPTGLIHTLFARTEGRLVATLETCAEAVDRVRAEVRLVQTMLDRLTFLYLVHTPEVPAAQRDTALGSGTRRHASWRQAAVRMADDGWLDRVLARSNGARRDA
jgi:hypothetical protein